jgi:RNA polymerase sigma-70 factor (ECF subfamily)
MIGQAALAKDLLVAEEDELARLLRRDPAAVACMVERYQHRLYRYLVRLAGQNSLADDLFQQTWLHVVRQIDRYDARRSFDTWLFAIAHNAAMDVLRRKPGESLDEEGAAWPAAGPDPLAVAITAERAAILAAEMDALPALYREALTLRFEEGMKLEEIAEVTGAPLSTVKSRVQRALESLRRSMTAHWRKEDLL